MKTKNTPATILATAILVVLTAITALVLLGCSGTKTVTKAETPANKPAPSTITITVYQPQECTCCSEYVPYLESEGFPVEVVFVEDAAALREKYPVPPGFRSCHLSVAGDYFVEGHVPSEVILTLLAQKPAIDGITLPGMPSGSPGMGGPKTEVFKFYALTDGVVSDFMTLP